jgi:CheY-like chemotaxis protein
MTANAMIGDKEHCLQIGMDGYVAKPLSVKELFEAIEALLSQSAAGFADSNALSAHSDR